MRYGRTRQTPSHRINFRSNIWALRELGVGRIVSHNAIGSVNPMLQPGDVVVCHAAMVLGLAGQCVPAFWLGLMLIELAPDVMLLDLAVPELDGFGVLTALAEASPRTRAVILTLYDNADARVRAGALGVREFVAKGEPSERLIAAIRRAAEPTRRPTRGRAGHTRSGRLAN